MSKRYLWLVGLVALGAGAQPAQSTPVVQDGWLPFEGCWRPSEAPAGNLLCIVGDGQGVRVIELTNGSIVREVRMVADGRARPVSQEGCSGEEKASWSSDGHRLYVQTNMKCGEQIPRNSTGLFALVSTREWVSVNAIAVDAEAATRTVRYELVEAPANVPESIVNALRTNRLARETARFAANSPLEMSDLSEAVQHVHGRAVEALLFERKQQFDVNGKRLVALSKTGVPGYLIDAVVAVSYPDRFAVRDARPTELAEPNAPRSSYRDRYCDDYYSWYDRFCSRYGGYGYGYYGSRYGYSPFGYYGYGSPPVVVIVNPGDNESIPRHGTVSRRGYSNGTSSTSGTRNVSSDSRNTGSSSGSSSSTSSSGSSSSSSSSSSSRGQAKPRGGN